MFFIKIMYVIDYGATRGTGALTFRGILESGMNFVGPRFFMQSSSSCWQTFRDFAGKVFVRQSKAWKRLQE